MILTYNFPLAYTKVVCSCPLCTSILNGWFSNCTPNKVTVQSLSLTVGSKNPTLYHFWSGSSYFGLNGSLSKFIQAQKLLNYGELFCLNFPQKSLENIMIPYKVSREVLPSYLQIQLKEKKLEKSAHTHTVRVLLWFRKPTTLWPGPDGLRARARASSNYYSLVNAMQTVFSKESFFYFVCTEQPL